MNIDIDTLLRIIPILMSIGTIVFAWFATRDKDVDSRFKGIQDDIKSEVGDIRNDHSELKDRVSGLEHDMAALPSQQDIHNMAITLTEMSGDMKAIRVQMKSMSEAMTRQQNILERHEDHLLAGGKS